MTKTEPAYALFPIAEAPDRFSDSEAPAAEDLQTECRIPGRT